MFRLEEYKKWLSGKEKIKYNLSSIQKFKFPENIVKIFSEIGLPKKVEPSIIFLEEKDNGLIRLNKYYDLSDEDYTDEFINEINNKLEKYIVIGKTTGHAICFDNEYKLYYVDYGNYNEVFINKSIEEFLECIMYYDKMVASIMYRNKGMNLEYEDYSDYINESDILELKNDLLSVVNGSLSDYKFWNCKIGYLTDEL